MVKIGDILSDELPTAYGVLQGSIIGSTLFLYYINKVCQIDLEICSVASYADGTALILY